MYHLVLFFYGELSNMSSICREMELKDDGHFQAGLVTQQVEPLFWTPTPFTGVLVQVPPATCLCSLGNSSAWTLPTCVGIQDRVPGCWLQLGAALAAASSWAMNQQLTRSPCVSLSIFLSLLHWLKVELVLRTRL